MDSGLSTVIGAIVGGGASLGGTYLAQRSQRLRDTASRRREIRERSLTAARIVLGDLAWARGRVKQALKNRQYWSVRYELTDASWSQYRETLALCLHSAEDWWAVHDAFQAVKTLQLQAAKRRGDDPQSRATLTKWGAERAETSLQRIGKAIALLEPLTGREMGDELIPEEP
jgi:hypothetical protein